MSALLEAITTASADEWVGAVGLGLVWAALGVWVFGAIVENVPSVGRWFR